MSKTDHHSEKNHNHWVLEANAIAKSYGPVKALKGVDLQLAKGSFTALLGPNGAGKSTLFQILTGLFLPDQGEIFIDQQSTRRSFTQALAKIGTVFQQITLDLDLTTRANLQFHTALHGMHQGLAQIRIEEEIQRFHLTEYLKCPVRQLSGGNRRKVELARALLHNPLLLLMDEPTVGLDPASRQQILRDTLQLCHQQHMSVLWATHLVDEAEAADQIIILDKGKVIAQGSPEALKQQQNSTSLSEAFFKLTQTTSISESVNSINNHQKN